MWWMCSTTLNFMKTIIAFLLLTVSLLGQVTNPSGSSIPTSSFGVMGTASKYGLHYDGRFIHDATITNGQNTVSCPNNDCNFTAADTGKICFGTNMTFGGGSTFTTATVILPQGTFTQTGAQTGTCSGGNATQTVTAAGVFVWGSDDTTPLSSAWTDTLAACTMLNLPGVNSQGTGPAVMLVQSAEFGVPNGSGKCAQTGGNGRGVGVKGQGIRATYIIPTPSFNFTTCTGNGITNQACFFGFSDGGDVEDFTLYGAGNSNPGAGGAGKTGVDMASSNWSYLKNVQLIGWGANASNGLQNGSYCASLWCVYDHVIIDGWGQTGLVTSIGSQGQMTILGSTFFDNSSSALSVGSSSPTNGVQSIGGFYGDSSSGCTINVTSGSFFQSISDNIGDNLPNSTAGDLCVQTTGVANVFNGMFSGTTNSMVGIKTLGTGAVRMRDTTVKLTGTTTTGLSNAGSITDLGGNTISANTTISGAGILYGSESITGTACATGNWALTSGWGTSSIASVTAGGDSHRCQVVITGAAGSAGPVLTWTFPTAYWKAPGSCQLNGTNASLTAVTSGTPSTTAIGFTFTGTPAAVTYTFDVSCGP